QIVSGMALNILIAGLAPTLALAWFHNGGNSPPLIGAQRFVAIDLPFGAAIDALPVVGRVFAELIDRQTAPVYLAAVAVPVVAWIMGRTRFGLNLRAVGENPLTVETA